MAGLFRTTLIATVLVVVFDSKVQAGGGYPVEGKVVLPEGKPFLPRTRVQLHTEDGRDLVAFPTRDGSFVLHDVPAGTHILDVDCMGLLFPQLRVDVSNLRNGAVVATHLENTQVVLPEPLLLRPLAEAQYYEVRKPFNIIAFLKSPMGMMMGFMVFAVLVLPMLKVDPEQYRELMGEAGQGAGQGQGAQQQVPAAVGSIQQQLQAAVAAGQRQRKRNN